MALRTPCRGRDTSREIHLVNIQADPSLTAPLKIESNSLRQYAEPADTTSLRVFAFLISFEDQ